MTHLRFSRSLISSAIVGAVLMASASISHAATTPNIALTVPTVGADNNNWGAEINTDLALIDAQWANIGNTPFGTAATRNTGTSGANVPLLNGVNTWSLGQTFTVAPVFTDQAGSRAALGLGSAATQNTGTSGATVPLLNASGLSWANSPTFVAGLTATSDITVERATAPATALIFLGNTGGHYLYHDGANFQFVGPGQLVGPTGGFTGNLTGTASHATSADSATSATTAANATTAGTANAVAAGAVTPAGLSAGAPTWNSGNADFLASGSKIGFTGDPNFWVGQAGGNYIIQLGAPWNIHVNTATGVLSFLNSGRNVMSVDGSGNVKALGNVSPFTTPDN